MNMPYQQPMMNYTPNYGAYQYNPMANYQRYQQPEPTQGISGRVVQAVETINPNEVPMDGSVAFFPFSAHCGDSPMSQRRAVCAESYHASMHGIWQ